MPLDVYRPPNLKCLNCKSPHLTIKQTKRLSDYRWRNMRCDVCGDHLQWGEPFEEGRNHMVMTATPKPSDDGKTENIAFALPLGATIKELKVNKVKVIMTITRDRYMQGKSLPLSPAEREELAKILEWTKKQYYYGDTQSYGKSRWNKEKRA